MYCAYLVDDEPLALLHMEKTFPWHEHAFDIAGKATCPLEAVSQILAIKPDVVFTDIHMGANNGLDLIEQLKGEGCTSLFVVVSAYDRFEYARRLMRMEGFDYIIKPLEPTQCAELLASLRARLCKLRGNTERPLTMSTELNRILTHLKANYMQKQTLGQIAQQFAISPNYICRLFSKHLGTTFSNYLTGLRMEQAASMLKTSDLSVKEIAGRSGYEDYFYFCRVFRETFECTPTQYRGRA